MPSRSVRAEKNNHNHNLLNHYNLQHAAGEGGGHSGQPEGDAGGPGGGGGGGLCALDIMDHLEMTARTNLLSKTDNNNGGAGDGLRLMMIDRNGGERSTEVSVPLVVPAPQHLHNQNNNHGGGGLKRTLSPGGGDNLCRLRDRKFLLEDKKRLCASALGTALLGILLMVVHQEMCPCVYTPGSVWAFIINCSISLSTLCLLFLILAFHYKDVQVFVIDHNQVDWRIAMTSHRLLGICVELLVCAIHPVGTYWELGTVPAVPNQRSSPAEDSSSNITSASSSSSWPRAPAPAPLCVSPGRGRTPLDVELLLSLLMFLRLYLVHRAILLHSKVLLSASYRSIGSLNNINFTFRFVLKVLMNNYPARTLTAFILAFWLTTSWMLTLCERQTSELTTASTRNMDVALWLIAITFLTVGYGDVSPQTSCGKTVCLFTGVMGVACTAMLVAVVTKKLALNKGEKHVHFFMLDIQVSKRIRHAAANVLRECWLLHRTNVTRGNGGEHRTHQRRLVEAIRVFRHLRLKQRKLRDYASEMVDLPKMQMIMCDLSANWNTSYRELEQRIVSMEHKLDELGRCFQQSTELLAAALRLRSTQDIR